MQQQLHQPAAAASSKCSWDDDLRQALADGLITGFALLTATGTCEADCGALSGQLVAAQGSGSKGQLTPAARAMLALFDAAGPVPMTSIDALGGRLIVVRRSDWQVMLLGHARRVGLLLHRLPYGVLATTWGHRQLPNVVASSVERVARRLKSV